MFLIKEQEMKKKTSIDESLVDSFKGLTWLHSEAVVWFWNFLPVNPAQATAAGRDPLHHVPSAGIGVRLPGEVKRPICAKQLRDRQLGIYRTKYQMSMD